MPKQLQFGRYASCRIIRHDTHLPSCCKLFRRPAERPSLPRHAVVSLVTSLVLTKLDYCNSLLIGLPAKLLNRLQAVINTAARLVCHAMKADHITPVLKDLYTGYESRKGSSIQAIVSLRSSVNTVWHHPTPVRPTSISRSNGAQTASEIIEFASARRTREGCHMGDRAFLVAAAKASNSLPLTCCVNPALIPSSPENSSIHRIFRTILVICILS